MNTRRHDVRSAALCLLLAAGSAAAQCTPNWVQASAGQPTVPTDPTIRQNTWAVFDSAHGLVLVFGGFLGGTGSFGDTWGWNGAAWTQLATTGPSARSVHSMAYDSARDRTVLFGGNAGGALGDTWEWNGVAWTQVFPATSPPGRFNLAMAFDSVRNVVVLTGGFSTVRYSDTWEYNGITWTERLGTTYGGRNGHGMAFDVSRNKMVIFGGFNGARLSDTREYDAASGNWSQIAVTGPSGRQYTHLTYDSHQHVILLFGGQTGPGTLLTDRQQDTWSYNGTAWTQIGEAGPSRRDQHVTVYDAARRQLVVFGGYQGASFGGVAGDTWVTGCPAACYPNCDSSTVLPCLNVLDFGCFLNAFAIGASYANCDGSTTPPILNVQDFGCFLNAFANGCSSC